MGWYTIDFTAFMCPPSSCCAFQWSWMLSSKSLPQYTFSFFIVLQTLFEHDWYLFLYPCKCTVSKRNHQVTWMQLACSNSLAVVEGSVLKFCKSHSCDLSTSSGLLHILLHQQGVAGTMRPRPSRHSSELASSPSVPTSMSTVTQCSPEEITLILATWSRLNVFSLPFITPVATAFMVRPTKHWTAADVNCCCHLAAYHGTVVLEETREQ